MDKHVVSEALARFQTEDFYTSALKFWKALGYESQRQPEDYEFSFEDFVSSSQHAENIRQNKAHGDQWKQFYLLFQITDAEIKNHFSEDRQADIFGDKTAFMPKLQSYIFAALELKGSSYSRTALADISRQINRSYAIPLILTIKYGTLITIAVINRRQHKLHKDKDVLEKVTLIKDINLVDPHRAHQEILSDLATESLFLKYSIGSFDDLHKAWAKTLDLQELNKRFYKELSNWYFWAVSSVEFPWGEEQDTLTRNSIAVIRLITRLIFVWFMKEKKLVPEILFDPDKIKTIIKFEDYNDSSYYKAILQNLFFATLNTEMNKEKTDSRRFRKTITGSQNADYQDHNLFRYESLFADPSSAISEYFGDIPFLNGGLFECLDTETTDGKQTRSIRIDGFSDRKDNVLKVPDCLFLLEDEKELDLNHIYGTSGKRYKIRGLLNILHSYKFTVAENTPVEEEVALDPELLGRVFEELLASYNPETRSTARHDTGSFYTPREIVDFMVNESLIVHLSDALKADTETQKKDNILRLRLLISYTDEEHLFTDQEADQLIEAVDTLRAIDPACGSGAFLMGLLLKMVYILHKLDPHNERWKAQQISKLKEQIDASKSITDFKIRAEVIGSFEERIKDIEDTFDDYDYDYSRKLFLIEHCIYGSDIQPIAIQIAKLRFFISLLVDQQKKAHRANFGIRSLPNLETNLVAANSLLSVELPEQSDIFDNGVEAFKNQIKGLHNQYFVTRSRAAKKTLRKNEMKLRQEFASSIISSGTETQLARLISNWSPFSSSEHAGFFDPGVMFGIDNFNLVITNPPYIRQEDIPDKPTLLKVGYKVYNSTSDIYTYFYELALNLLCEGGIAAFITSNKWMKSKYGFKLRELLANESSLLAIIDFGGYKVFESATVDTNIAIFRKAKANPKMKVPFLNIDSSFDGCNLEAYFYDRHKLMPQNSLQSTGWTFADSKVVNLKEKIERMGKPLKDWGINIYYGIKTGCNDCFVIDTPTKDQICSVDPESIDFIKPLLRGRDIHRYHYEWAGLWIIIIPSGWTNDNRGDIEAETFIKSSLPGIYSHLIESAQKKVTGKGKGLFNRDDQGDYWWELRDCTYYDKFSKEKIVYPNMTKYQPFVSDKNGYITNQKCFILTADSNILYPLLGLLNSRLMFYYIKSTFPELLGGTRELNKDRFELLPINEGLINNSELVGYVKTQLDLLENAQDVSQIINSPEFVECDKAIDRIIYSAYDLSNDEIQIVEGGGSGK